jgi:nucleotide-binding universal stress UspA family protein
MLPKTIVVATDFSEEALRATDYAVELAQMVDAEVFVVNAYTAPALALPELTPGYTGMVEEAADDAQRQLDKLINGYSKAHVPMQAVLRCGDAVDTVVGVARAVNADLIVIGTHARTGLSRAVLGSVAESVVRHAPCAVLAVH